MTPTAPPHLTPRTFPGAKPFIGVLPQLQADPLGVMERATLEFGPVAQLKLPTTVGHVLGTPKLAHHVLVANVKNYAKQTLGYKALRLALGNGLVTSEGDFWKRQRRIAQPAFHRERLANFGVIMTRAADEMVDRWPMGEPFDFAHEMMRVTMRIVGEALLSADVTGTSGEVGEALTDALEALIHRTLHPLSPPMWLPTPRNLRFKKALAKLDGVVLGIIDERRRNPGRHDDLLAMLMESKDPETGQGMTDAQLRDEVMTIFLAGHETTANNLAWTAVLLGQNPAVERRLVQEIDEQLHGALPAMESVGRLPFATNVVKESLRLYPPVWVLARKVLEDDTVDGWFFPKGSMVFVSPWALHRLPEYWEAPLAFDPDRWSQEDPRRQHGSYLPFSMGQRKCIGDMFAMVEAQLILTTILQRVKLSLVPGQKFETEPVITLRPRGGVRVVATRR